MDEFKKEVRFVVKISAIFALLWFASNYAYNYGLLYTSVTSSVILSSTNPTWIYLISLSCIVPQMHRKKFSIIKLLLVITSLCGFITIAMQDKSSEGGSLVGDLFTVLSAIFFAFYSIFLKVAIPEEQEATFKFSWFLGFVGLINDVAILPLFFIFNLTGLEVFQWPNR